MKTAICTLYEGNYHLGVGALINSLIVNGFDGDIYVGYRGQLPSWLKQYQTTDLESWKQAPFMRLSNGSTVYFLLLQTNIHFTNYKPQFLIDLTTGVCKNYNAIVYFDPDIVVCRHWEYFEDWMQHGVAVVHESVTNDMPPTHPLRRRWMNIAKEEGNEVHHQIHSYINGGFCGLLLSHLSFLHTWQKFIDIGIQKYYAENKNFMTHTRPYPFRSLDQDALNITAMVYEQEISEVGPEAMGFVHGVVAMAHAVGRHKPWNKSFLYNSFLGNSPTFADKSFWKYANGEIKLYSKNYLGIKKLSMLASSFIGRFYKRN